jgi:hypothetical protein
MNAAADGRNVTLALRTDPVASPPPVSCATAGVATSTATAIAAAPTPNPFITLPLPQAAALGLAPTGGLVTKKSKMNANPARDSPRRADRLDRRQMLAKHA